MKTPPLIGFLLNAFAVIAFAYQGFSCTTREKAIDIVPLAFPAS